MTDAPDLSYRFLEILSQKPTSTIETEDQECASMLYETEWTRIFIVQKPESPECVRIEVEVSQPSLSLSQLCASPDVSKQDERTTRELLEQLIRHIEYILKLESSGFSIDFVGNDCLILAVQSFTETPSAEVFELLLPPV